MKINCCPKCGSTIEVSILCQYSRNHIIGKRGKMLKKYKRRDEGSIDAALAFCTNEACDVQWEDRDFAIDENECFFDLKYTEKSRGW